MKNTVYYNCRVYTQDPEIPWADYVWVEGNRIKIAGTVSDLIMDQPDVEYIDANGTFVFPGFNDAHLHLSTVGANLYDCNLEGVKSIEELQMRLGDYIRQNEVPEGSWVLGKGWNQDYFEIPTLPHKKDLDEVTMDHKVCLIRGCYHMSVINSAAITALDITPDKEVEGGVFDVDRDGLTGICRENAMKFVLENLPPITIERFKEYIRRAQEHLLSLGVTSAQTDDFMLAGVKWQDAITAYLEMARDDELKVRIFEQCLLPKLSDLDEFLAHQYQTINQGKFRVEMLKLLADGNFGNRTAALNEPFAGEPGNYGIMNYSADELAELFKKAYSNNFRIGVHCIGDRAAEMVLEAEENTAYLYDGETRMHMIHCQMANEKILDKMKKLHVIGNIQPSFLDYDIHMVESRLGKDRLPMTYNWKTMLERGIRLAMGTDSPISYVSPFLGIYCAVTRQDYAGNPPGGWYPKQQLSISQAIEAYTIGSAYGIFEEHQLGRIAPGMLADVIFVDTNLLECNSKDLLNVKVLRTIVDGQVCYESETIS